MPDLIDERFDEIVRELRSGEVTASPELRLRVRAIVEREPEPPLASARLRLLPRRRVGLVLVPAVAIVAAAVGVGVFSSGGGRKQADYGRQSKQYKPGGIHTASTRDTPKEQGRAQLSPAPLPPSGSRAQLYAVDLRLRVSDLSAATKRAIELTRGWGGYVLSVDSGSGQQSGSADLVLRIPIVKVQPALVKLAALGKILADHVSIQDVQRQLNKRFSEMQTLRVKIADLRARLTDTSLTASQRAFFEAAIVQRQARLANLRQAQAVEKTRTSFATVSLGLETKKHAAVVPSKPGRIGQALHDIGRVLVTEAEILLYVLLIGAPFMLVAALAWATRRSLRRRSEEQLLAR